MFQILYGVENKYIDVTDKVKRYCIYNDYIIIPDGDSNRANIFF